MKNLNLLSLEDSQCQNNHNKNKLFLIFLKIPKLHSTLLDKEANEKSQMSLTYRNQTYNSYLCFFHHDMILWAHYNKTMLYTSTSRPFLINNNSGNIPSPFCLSPDYHLSGLTIKIIVMAQK